MWAPGMEPQHPRVNICLTLRQHWRVWDAKLPLPPTCRPNSWNRNCKWGKAWARLGRGRKNRQRNNKGRTWTNKVKSHWGNASKAGKQLHYSPPGITNLEIDPEIMQWSNAYKNVCTLNKPLEGSIPTRRHHGIFYTLYRLPQTSQEYMLCLHWAQPDFISP